MSWVKNDLSWVKNEILWVKNDPDKNYPQAGRVGFRKGISAERHGRFVVGEERPFTTEIDVEFHHGRLTGEL